MRATDKHIYILLIFVCMLVSGCHSGLTSRIDKKNSLVDAIGYAETELQTHPFKIYAAVPHVIHKPNAIVVIEGDGYAFSSRYRVSNNPTPTDPVGLRIIKSSDSGAIYLARPCQYVWQETCTPEYWSSKRFSREVLQSYNDALNQLKHRYNINTFHLVGFSGGAYVSLMLAATRDDIERVDTIAGLLDPQRWVEFHGLSPLILDYSANELIMRSKGVAFDHLCSEKDKVLPCSLHREFVNKARLKHLNNHSLKEDRGSGHSDLWKVYELEP
jgi:hypothetical protein